MNPKCTTSKAPNFDDTWEAARGYFSSSHFHHFTANETFEDTSSLEHKKMEQWSGNAPQDPQHYNSNLWYNCDQYNCNTYCPCNSASHSTFNHNHRHAQDLKDEDDPSLSNIIARVHTLSTRDAEYAVLYAWCMQLSPNVARCLVKPEMFRAVHPSPSPTPSESGPGRSGCLGSA